MTDLGLRHVKIYADGADLESIVALASRPEIAGFTTNPTLMRKSGVSDYEAFARKVLDAITDRPVSFEVLRRRTRGHGAPGPAHRFLGTERPRQDPGHRHRRRAPAST